MKKKIINSEKYDARWKRGVVLHSCILNCGHVQRGNNQDIKNGEMYCMVCYFEENKQYTK